jgi:hypothetical protein
MLARQPIPHSMERLQVELVVRLGRNEAHVLPIASFSNRFGIEKAVLSFRTLSARIIRLRSRRYEYEDAKSEARQ